MTPLTMTAEMMGFAGGALGICAAVWLQMVARRAVPAKRIAALFAVGSMLMMMNLGPIWPEGASNARLSANVAVLAAQMFYAKKTWDEAPRENRHGSPADSGGSA